MSWEVTSAKGYIEYVGGSADTEEAALDQLIGAHQRLRELQRAESARMAKLPRWKKWLARKLGL